MTPPTPPTPPPPAPSPAAEADKRASFEREALVHLDSLYRVALRLTGNPAEADDLVQETMFKAYRAWHQFERGTNAKGWLLTILRHAFINEYRRRTRHPETVDIDAIEPFSVFEELQDEDRSEEHTSELQSQSNLVCRLLLEKKKKHYMI